MRYLAATYLLGFSWFFLVSAFRVIPKTYIVNLDSTLSVKNRASRIHIEFYRKLQSQDIDWITTQEYNDPIFMGAVVQLRNETDLPKLIDIAGAESVKPVHFDSPSVRPIKNHTESKWKRNGNTPWPLSMIGADIVHAEGYTGQGITIGIIDSGVDYMHPDLGGGMGPRKKVIGGHDFVGNDWTGLPNSPPARPSSNPLDQCDGHGTMVAGIIGANPNYEEGVVGVAYGAKIRAYRINGCSGGRREDITLAAFLRANREANDIITYSAAHFDEWAQTSLATVLDRIAANGRVVTMSTGNYGRYGAWAGADTGSHQGIIAVGHVLRLNVAPSIENSRGAMMSSISSYGPSIQAGMSLAIAAPGENVRSTWPVPKGRYIVDTGTSVATPFVAGAVALWLEAKKKSQHNAWAARAIFQNTALPMRNSGRPGSLVDTVAHQGAGLIQIDRAIFGRGSMSPAELQLNDTVYAKLDWTIYITNPARTAVTYTLTHEPAGTAPTINGIECIFGPLSLFPGSASVRDFPTQITVPAGRAKPFSVTFQPPTGLDPRSFPVYSGYIKATGSDGSTLRSAYIGVAASMNRMKVLDNTNNFNGLKLPLVTDGHNQAIIGPTTYTMQGADIPVLWFRLVAYTPLIRVDLVDAGARIVTNQRRADSSLSQMNPPKGFVQRRSALGRIWRSWRASRGSSRSRGTRRSCSWSGGLESGPTSGRRPGNFRTNSGSAGQCRIFGTILESQTRRRNVITPRRDGPDRLPIDHFAGGRFIPDGSYRLLLSVLRNFGDPRDEREYETWLSPQINIQRP